MNKIPHEELLAFLKTADSYSQDTREWPDPTEPRPSGIPAPQGCTCHKGDKLHCPLHGLNGENPADETTDHSWSMPENSPVGFPQDQPRNWTQAVSSRQWYPVVVGHSQSEIVPIVGQAVDVEHGFVPFGPLKHGGGPLDEGGEDRVHGLDRSGVHFESFAGHRQRLARPDPGVNQTDEGGEYHVEADNRSDEPHRHPQRLWSVKQAFIHSAPSQSVAGIEQTIDHKWSVTQVWPFKHSVVVPCRTCSL